MKNKTILYLVVAGIIVFGVAWFSGMRVSGSFPQSVSGLPDAKASEIVELKDGDTYDLTASYVKKSINGKEYRMLSYNGSIPGPTIKIPQGAEVSINFKNDTDVKALLHSHGVRMDNAYDGSQATQKEMAPGESFAYKLKFPDAGIFWYHPHVREDYTQPLGLYGNFLVVSNDPNYLAPVNKEEIVALGDILMDENGIAPYSKNNVDYALMGRFGNVMLVNGTTDYALSINKGDVVRFYFTNVATARPFSISIPGAKMKLVAGDQSKYEREQFVESIILSPSERAVVDVYFKEPGQYNLLHANPLKSYVLGAISVSDEQSSPSYAASFATLRTNSDVARDIDNFRKYFAKEPDKRLKLTIAMGGSSTGMGGMHMMPDGTMMSNSGMAMHGSDEGIEWEDTMRAMNKAMDATTEWKIVDEDTGKENMDINWELKKGEPVKIRVTNDSQAMHPMQHPIHFHGQRFLVISRNGKAETNLVWKDTVLVKAGETVEILLDPSNPGEWMAHCHIAEHLESGMMFTMSVK